MVIESELMSLLSWPLPTLSAYANGSEGIPYIVDLQGEKPGPTVMITALIHGNEICGAFALDQFLKTTPQIAAGRLICVFANIGAYQKFNSRYPFATRYIDVDMNRLWAEDILMSEQKNKELKRARQLLPLIQASDYILDLHSMGSHQTPLILAGTDPEDIAFAEKFRLTPYIISDAGHPQGPRLRDYKYSRQAKGKAKPISVLVECGQHWQITSVDMARTAIAQMLFLTGLRVDQPEMPDALTPKVIDVTAVIQAQHQDFAIPPHLQQPTLMAVQKGDVIATEKGRVYHAPYNNCYLIMPAFRPIKGYTALRLGRERHAI